MRRVYMCIGATSFDPEYLTKQQKYDLGVGDKPSFGTWATPFNVPNIPSWEEYLVYQLDNISPQESLMYGGPKMDILPFAQAHGYATKKEFYDAPFKDQLVVMREQKKSIEEAAQKAHEMSKAQRIEAAVNNRSNAFFFTVDPDKILCIDSIEDIFLFLEYPEYGPVRHRWGT